MFSKNKNITQTNVLYEYEREICYTNKNLTYSCCGHPSRCKEFVSFSSDLPNGEESIIYIAGADQWQTVRPRTLVPFITCLALDNDFDRFDTGAPTQSCFFPMAGRMW
jgi:hypothetical protein